MNWIICFKSANNIGPWKLFTSHRPDFGHVFAVRYDPDLKMWIRFECASQKFNFELSYRGKKPIFCSMTW